LTQPVVGVGAAPGRFVRLVWADAAAAPLVTGATVVVAARHQVAVEPARELTLAPSAPASAAASDPAARRALEFDLGGAMPLLDVDLRFASGTHVAPVRLYGRTRADRAWRELGGAVFYRLERGSDVGTSPAVALPGTVRFLRIVPDERAAALDAASVRLVVHASLASIVFATQGEPPFQLLAGSPDAPAGALPVAMVVPQLESERPRFGRASLGEFAADADAARAADDARAWRDSGRGCSGRCSSSASPCSARSSGVSRGPGRRRLRRRRSAQRRGTRRPGSAPRCDRRRSW
jgi:hypothetical protein